MSAGLVQRVRKPKDSEGAEMAIEAAEREAAFGTHRTSRITGKPA